MAVRKKDPTLENDNDDTDAPVRSRKGPEPIEVSLDPDDDDDEPDATDPEPVASRKERRKERGKLREEADRLRVEVADRDRRLADAEARIARVDGYIQGQRAAGGSQADPLDAKLKEIEQENQAVVDQYNAIGDKATPLQLEQWRRKATELRHREYEIIAERRDRARAPSAEQQAQGERERLLLAKYPELGDPKIRAWAEARSKQLDLEGHAAGWDRTETVMREARAKFNGRKEPDPTMPRKLAGMPRGASGGGASGGSRRTFTMDAGHQAVADQMFKHIKDDKQRYTHYARTVGAKILAKEDRGS